MSHRVLVTGANGFVGAAVCRHLLVQGRTPRGSVRGGGVAVPDGIESCVSGPIDGTTDWRPCLNGIDAVIHCAARVHVLREDAAAPLAAFRKVNVDGSRTLAREAVSAGVRRIVFLSSIGATLAEEDAETATPYQQSKLEAEAALRQVVKGTATSLVILRPPLVYGPGAPGNFRRLASLVARGLPLPLAGISNRRSFIYLGNLTSAIEAALTVEKAPNAALALADGVDLSTPELLRRMGLAAQKPVRLWPCPLGLLNLAGRLSGRGAAVEALTATLTVDNGPVCKALGWTPPFSVDEGLSATFASGAGAERR